MNYQSVLLDWKSPQSLLVFVMIMDLLKSTSQLCDDCGLTEEHFPALWWLWTCWRALPSFVMIVDLLKSTSQLWILLWQILFYFVSQNGRSSQTFLSKKWLLGHHNLPDLCPEPVVAPMSCGLSHPAGLWILWQVPEIMPSSQVVPPAGAKWKHVIYMRVVQCMYTDTSYASETFHAETRKKHH